MTEDDWSYEMQRLDVVLREIRRQSDQLGAKSDHRRGDVVESRRQMYDELPHFPVSFEAVVEIAQSVEQMGRREREYMFSSELRERLERLLASPYFGRMDFREAGESAAEPIYIGLSSLIAGDSGEPLIYDWRAPVSSMYYDYATGPAQYQAPGGVIRGEIERKRQYKIRDGRIEYMFDTGLHIGDDLLAEMLGRNADAKMHNIVTTIQREQNRVIRDEQHRVLVVQGPAGSGKTSIALQRIAYLLYRHRRSLAAHNILFLTPNRLFQDYISLVLPELGERNTLQTTLEEYADSLFRGEIPLEGLHAQLESLYGVAESPQQRLRGEGIRYKGSAAFARVLERYVDWLSRGGLRFEDIKVDRKTLFAKEETEHLFYQQYAHLPAPRRFAAIRLRIAEALDAAEGPLVQQVYQKLLRSDRYLGEEHELRAYSEAVMRRKLRAVRDRLRDLPAVDVVQLYTRLWEDEALFNRFAEGLPLPADIRGIRAWTVERLQAGREIPHEDVWPLVFLKGALQGAPSLTAVRHVMIDEAQDYSPLQYEIIRQLFPHSRFTLLGDLNQSIHPYTGLTDYRTVLDVFGESETQVVRLHQTYRSTAEIARFAAAVLAAGQAAGGDVRTVERPGPKPKLVRVSHTGAVVAEVAAAVEQMLADGLRTVAIICKTAAESAALHEVLATFTKARLVVTGDQPLTVGTVVIPVYLAKGLEFDGVILPDVSAQVYQTEADRRLLYTACARALHRLVLYTAGEWAPWIAQVSPDLYEACVISPK
ncbi:MAG: UvrD-helicase domain-containing protein [Alicyclobacillaceae bacterium]|nr:UvrD-helicase domain-containing protein [Alicyclobacillaceae bacterium]